MQYITKTDVANYSGISFSSAEQTEIERLCKAVSKSFESYTNRQYVSSTGDTKVDEVEVINANFLFLQATPATSITKIEVLDIGSDPEEWTEVTDAYHLVNGYKVILSIQLTGHIKITYKGSAIPEDAKQALIEWVLLIWGAKFQDGKWAKQESTGARNKQYLTTDSLPTNITSVLDRYRIIYV